MKPAKRFVLASGEIVDFEIQTILEKGHEHKVKAKVKGNGKYIFLTLLLVDPKGNQLWWGDNDTIDLVKNGGKLELNNSEYENTWYFPVFNDALSGDYTAFLGMYQDTYDLPTVNRRLVNYVIRELKVVEGVTEGGQQQASTNINIAGLRSDEQDFELLRDRIMWCICHNLSKNRRTFHAADMISECARGYYDKNGIEQYKSTGKHEFYEPVLERIYGPLVERHLIEKDDKNNYTIPEGSKLEKICKISEGKAYMNWNEIDWDYS